MKKELGTAVLGGLVVVALLGATGTLTLRDDGIQFPDGTVQTTAAASELHIVDSQGARIGPLVGLHDGGRMITYLRLGADQDPVFFDIYPDRYEPLHAGLTVFLEPDCNGQAYIAQLGNTDPLSGFMYSFGGPGTLYRADSAQTSSDEPVSRWDHSWAWTVGDFTDHCSPVSLPDLMGSPILPAEVFSDLSTLPYSPEFRLE